MIGDLGAEDATALAGMVAAGEVTPTELLDAALAAVEARNPALNAVVLVQEGVARQGDCRGLAAGAVPGRAVPDQGPRDARRWISRRTMARACLPTRVYPGDSSIFARMQATGVVTFGRTTSPEGGVGAATEAAVYGGPTRNPWNARPYPGRVVGRRGGGGGGGDRGHCAWVGRRRVGADSGLLLRAVRVQADAGAAAGRSLCRRGLGGDGDRRVPDAVGPRYGGDAGRLRGGGPWRALCGAAAWRGAMPAAISRPPRRLRVGICDTTLTGERDPSGGGRGGASGRAAAGIAWGIRWNRRCPRRTCR